MEIDTELCLLERSGEDEWNSFESLESEALRVEMEFEEGIQLRHTLLSVLQLDHFVAFCRVADPA